MNEKQKFNVLKRLFSEPEITPLLDILIYNTETGYTLFNDYDIDIKKKRYVVTKRNTDLYEVFYNLKTAIIWVTLYKRNKIVDANRVRDLDVILEGAKLNHELHSKLFEKTKDLELKSLYSAKLHEDSSKIQLIVNELNDYSKDSKNWQSQRFNKVR